MGSPSLVLTQLNFNYCTLGRLQSGMRGRDEKSLFCLNAVTFVFLALHCENNQLLTFDPDFYFKIYFTMA